MVCGGRRAADGEWRGVVGGGGEEGRDARCVKFQEGALTDARRHSSEFSIGSRGHYSVKPITKRALDYEIDSHARPIDRIYTPPFLSLSLPLHSS